MRKINFVLLMFLFAIVSISALSMPVGIDGYSVDLDPLSETISTEDRKELTIREFINNIDPRSSVRCTKKHISGFGLNVTDEALIGVENERNPLAPISYVYLFTISGAKSNVFAFLKDENIPIPREEAPPSAVDTKDPKRDKNVSPETVLRQPFRFHFPKKDREEFLKEGLLDLKNTFQKNGIGFEEEKIYDDPDSQELLIYETILIGNYLNFKLLLEDLSEKSKHEK